MEPHFHTASAGVRRRELSRFKQVEREDCAHPGGRFGDRSRRSASLRVGCNLRLRRFGWTVRARMIAAFSSRSCLMSGSRSLDWRGNPIALLVRTSTNARSAMPTFCMPGRPSYSARIITNIFYTGMDNSNTKRERQPERDNGAGLLRLGNPNLTVRFANRNLGPTKRALSRNFFLARDRRARNYFRTHDLFYLAFPMKGCEQGDYNEAK
jgi:hypothetical protein